MKFKNDESVSFFGIFIFAIIMLLFTFIGINLSSKDNSDRTTYTDLYFTGKKELRKFNFDNGFKSSSKTSFFLFGSSHSSKSETNRVIIFSWKNKDHYLISEIPISKIRIKFNNNIEKPYIKFHSDEELTRWNTIPFKNNKSKVQSMIENDIDYVTVHCKEEHYQYSVNLNYNEELNNP